MARLLSYNKPEWPFFIPAILGALIDGSAMPAGQPKGVCGELIHVNVLRLWDIVKYMEI